MKEENEVQRKYDLEERLIDFAIIAIKISEKLFDTKAGNHISGQLVRSGTSPALNYGEAHSAESSADFIHKLKVLLKELRESRVSFKIIKKAPLTNDVAPVEIATTVCNELISIFVKSIQTAKKNSEKGK
ncbi:MAG: four helix bundle protein [Chitinophagales bacterium]|nr:four helix bundle protein [Chitinophagales bacterium]